MKTWNMTALRRVAAACVAVLLALPGAAQQTAYKTFVYTSDELANEISRMNGERDASRGYLGDLFNATKGSAKG
ncbi:MAG: hypothetical protein IJ928_04070, partial [Prevotella sp.]|nr:hypothetical protein [Prevotella sp.]